MKTRFLIILIIISSSGCAYFEQRARDFGDCFRLNAGAGLGVSADAQVFCFKAGVGYWQGYCAGLNRKSEIGIWHEKYRGIPICQIEGAMQEGLGVLEAFSTSSTILEIENSIYKNRENSRDLQESALVFIYFKSVGMTIGDPRMETKWTDYFWINANASCFLRFNVGFNIAELFDFILGWFGLDIAGDDKLRTP